MSGHLRIRVVDGAASARALAALHRALNRRTAPADLPEWRPRLAERIDEQRDWLRRQVHAGLSQGW